ncbi:TolC family protein [Bacteroides sp. 51]|uniref:TolC family protein n=1 Tax=Bacteroides sp. 51 TaxID=2302938 RepID=UPI0013D72A4F|nr:TolC family protein [Bacteroides sp. 51]NDV84004.1 TolC family protein [Bacteroides sp. 51]
MKTKVFTATLMLLFSSTLFAQEPLTLSLKECVSLATEKNINVAQSQLEQEKSHYKKQESLSVLLPQIEISGTFQDNNQLSRTMLPGEILGQPGTTIPVQLGSQFNTSAVISANQILYNQTALTSLKLSKKAEFVATLGVEKAKEEIAKEVAKLYFLIQTSAEQIQLVQDNIERTQRITDIVRKQVDNGIGKKVDYDRIMVTLQNLQTQLDNNQALYEQQINMMKYMLEIPSDSNIILTDSADMILVTTFPNANANFSNHIDIQILEAQKDLALQNQRVVNAGYVPSLSFFAQYGYQGLRNDFSDYFNSSSNNKWYASSYFGVRLSIPIFDGLQKRSKSRQAKTDFLKADLSLENKKERFSVDYKNALNNYINNKMTVERQENNIALAQNVYQETALKYREGMATMSDLLQDEMSLSNAQAGYLNALYKFKEAEIEIMSLNGKITELINQ